MSLNGDPVEEPLPAAPHISLVETVESELDLPMDWNVHSAAGISRAHIAEGADPLTEARIRLWHPPIAWNGGWRIPLKQPTFLPFYGVTLVKWCPPMWWPPVKINRGQLAIWPVPGDKHRTVTSGQEEWLGNQPPVPPKSLKPPEMPRPEASHPDQLHQESI